MEHILFVGLYPNAIEKYQNVFFQNLIFAVRDMGYQCTVISPVSRTRYRKKISEIPKKSVDYTSNGKDVTVYYPRTLSFSSKTICGVHFFRFTEWAFRKSAEKCARMITDADAVYGHFLLRGGLTALSIARKKKLSGYIAYGECSYESEVSTPYGKIHEKQLSGLTGVISVSTKNKNELLQNLPISESKVLLAPNAVDIDLFRIIDKTVSEQKLGLEHNDLFTVGFVGGFIERKGDKRLLAAIDELDGVCGMFAGRGDNPPSGDKVKFCGALKHEMLPYFYNSIDIFVLPTLAEGCCNAIIEALACGKPVISSNLDFNYDILNESNSILINPNSVEEIKQAIDTLKNNKALLDRLSKGATKTAERLSIQVRAEKIVLFMKNGS